MSMVLRLIDANANRAREALRVLEDYARFILNDDALTAGLKKIRHTLAEALGPILPDAILHRDTPNDIGKAVTTPTEFQRQGPGHVVTAAGKRLGEALRSLEEYLKIDYPASAHALETLRYDFYDLERRIGLTFRASHDRLAAARLYVLITESACKQDWFATARAAIAGGADILQLREKDLESGELLRRAKVMTALCRDHGVLSIINDRLDIALLSDADGLHAGQTDISAIDARKLLGSGKILGVSTHEPVHARRAKLDSADYIGAGPVYRSPTKPREISPGIAYLKELNDFSLPVFAIAGITLERVPEVVGTGVGRVAVTSAVTASDDPAAACRAIKNRLTAVSGKICP